MWAAHWDNREIAEILLRAGANVNAADDYGANPNAQTSSTGATALM